MLQQQLDADGDQKIEAYEGDQHLQVKHQILVEDFLEHICTQTIDRNLGQIPMENLR